MSPDDPRHGTTAGYRAHGPGGSACYPCRAAATEYQRKLLIDHILKRPRRMDARGTIRRIQALYAIGWTAQDIGTAAGLSNPRRVRAIANQARVGHDMAAAIDRAYRALCMKPGPSAVNRERAKIEGWAPPLAWDDIDHDDSPAGLIREARGCGTRYGYYRHMRRSEVACRPCKDATAKHERDKARARGAKPRNFADGRHS